MLDTCWEALAEEVKLAEYPMEPAYRYQPASLSNVESVTHIPLEFCERTLMTSCLSPALHLRVIPSEPTTDLI